VCFFSRKCIDNKYWRTSYLHPTDKILHKCGIYQVSRYEPKISFLRVACGSSVGDHSKSVLDTLAPIVFDYSYSGCRRMTTKPVVMVGKTEKPTRRPHGTTIYLCTPSVGRTSKRFLLRNRWSRRYGTAANTEHEPRLNNWTVSRTSAGDYDAGNLYSACRLGGRRCYSDFSQTVRRAHVSASFSPFESHP